MDRLEFDGQVVIVTGAGNGIGRAHALEFARRGARVVVNDLGGAADGTGADESAAAKVVAEIVAAGGEAVANTDSVATEEGGARITQTALDAFGQVDVVIANAGILRDVSLGKLTTAQLDAVLDVHLRGSFFTCLPAFRWMKENGVAGRFVLTTSTSGLFGNFGQANYAAAKMGIFGLMRVLSIEGARSNIRANAIAPVAKTRLTVGSDVEDDLMAPSRVTPIVVALSHPSSTVTGETFLSGWGVFARTFVAQAPGWIYGDSAVSAEDVVAHWDQIRDAANAKEVPNGNAIGEWMAARLAE